MYVKRNFSLFILFPRLPSFIFVFRLWHRKRNIPRNSTYICASHASFYLAMSVFSRGRGPQRIFPLSYIFHGACRLNPPQYIVHSRNECHRKEHRDAWKKGESRAKRKRIRGRNSVRRVNIPPLRASFMVKLRTNDRVSMRRFSGAKKEIEKRGERKCKKTGARKEKERDCRSLSRVSRASRENEFGMERGSGGEKMRKVEGERNGKRHAGALSSRRVESWNTIGF